MANQSRSATFPPVIDSTIIASFTDCPLKCYREYFLRLGSEDPSIHLHAGGCFAKAIEVVRRNRWELELPFKECLEAAFSAFVKKWGAYDSVPDHGTGANKTFDRVWSAVEYYFEQFPIESDPIKPHIFADGRSGVEFSFAVPLPLQNPDTGEPVLYAGRFDLLGYYNDLHAVIDEKTTTALGRTWPDQWTMRGQMYGYVWGARQSGVNCRTAIIRGVAILKTKFNHLEVIKTGIYTDKLLDRWYGQMLNKVQYMISLYRLQKESETEPEQIWPMNYGSAFMTCTLCPFEDLCTSENPEIWYGDYGERTWNPLTEDD